MEDSENNTAPCQILLFGDLSFPFEDDLAALLLVRDNPLLSSFFEQAGAAIRQEIGQLSTERQSLFPRFTTLIDLVSKLGETNGTPILRFCLLPICEVGHFVNYFGRNGRVYPTPRDTSCVGICAGSFAAAAVGVSRSLTELIPTATEAAVAAFRTALLSFVAKTDIIGSDPQQGGSWSTVVAGEEHDLEQKIEAFAASQSLQPGWRPYVSAITPSHVTLSGPPRVLSHFLSTHQFKTFELPIESPYHAPHLFNDLSVEAIVGYIKEGVFDSHQPYLTLRSASTGASVVAGSYAALLAQIVRDSLCEKVHWDLILDGVVKDLSRRNVKSCAIIPICTNTAHILSAALERAKVNVDVEKSLAWPVPTTAQQGNFAHSKIAIIGYSGRFPDSASNEEFWELLRAGKDVHREIPEDRFNWKTHYDPTGKTKNTSRVKYGCFIKEPGVFDARFFNISPREAENTDPAQRLAITTAYEAMEMAGMVTNRTPSTQQDRIGVFYGTTSDDWREVNSGQNVDTYFIPGGNRAFVPGRISYFFRFSGPSLSMDTACSSSFAAIQTACAYLWRGECDTAVAGGTNVLTNPDNFVGLDRGHFLTTTGNCNTFDDGASGYCRSDAVGTVILKRLEDAEMDNDPIFGIINGATTNHCGQTDSITRPHEGDQTSVFKRIIRHAGVNPLDISYIEMHGTGTQAGDATEMNSVLSVFVPKRQRMPRYPIYLGSAKANIGHAESASGVASLIKVLMMMKHSEIPPHCGIKTKINHNYPLDLKDRNVNIAFEPRPWRRDDMPSGKRFAFLNNFSAAGGNTAVLLEDAPRSNVSAVSDQRTFHVVVVSSRTARSLKDNTEALIKYLNTNPETKVSSISYTTTARRIQHNYRVSVVGNDATSIATALQSKMSTLEPKTIPPPAKIPKVVFVFTGQGTFYAGAGKQLSTVSSFTEDLGRFDRICLQHGFPSFLKAIQDPNADVGSDPVVTQLATACAQMALSKLWKSWGVLPSLAIGHSLGEYAALYAADALSASDAIFLVGTRARLLTQFCKSGTHSMLAVKASADTVDMVLQGSTAEAACFNQPTGVVVSGTLNEINRLKEVFKSRGHDTTQLDVPFAFHSTQVEPILKEFESKSRTVKFQPLSTAYISPLLAEVLPEGHILDASYLVRACRQAVNFQGALQTTLNSELINEKTIWLEIGSHPTCSGMIKGTLGSKSNTAASLRKDTDTWKVLGTTLELLYLNGIDLNWNEYHRDFEKLNRVIELPRYCWDLKNYWIMYRNDFCLTKGEGTKPAETPIVEVPRTFKYISPSLQRVIEESHDNSSSTLLVESNVHDPKLYPIFSGHRVNGAELCPSSLYADIAMNLTAYLMEQQSRSTDSIGMDVCQMKIDKALVVNPQIDFQLFRSSAQADWSENTVKVAVFSVNDQGAKTDSHITCLVRVKPARVWANEWNRNAYLIRSRIKDLYRAVEEGEVHRLKRGLVYRLFSNIVDYSPEYQGMEEVVIDTNELEAVSTVSFQVDDKGFYFNAQWMDSLGGVAGFIMNGNESPHPQAEVFINHGWEELKITSKFEKGKTYHAYNRMQLVEGTLYAGDTYVFDGERIVALFQGVKFMGVPRRVLDALNPRGRPTQTKAVPSPSSKAKVQARKIEPVIKPPAPTTTAGGIWVGILAVLSEEVGVELKDLMPETEFSDLGIDSLLSLTITGRIREEFDLDLPASVFVDFPTLKDLQQAHGQSSSPLASPTATASSSIGGQSGTSTPNTSLESEDGSLDFIAILRSTIAEETGIQMQELLPSTRLDELGVDSLLALTTMGKLSEQLNAELPSSLFADNETIGEIERAVADVLGVNAAPSFSCTLSGTNKINISDDPVVQSEPHATSVLLQGSPNSAVFTLFMFPDGSGSASSYATMARIDPKVAVWGLNCPWRTNPEDMARSGCNLVQLTTKYVVELRRRQPKGPYNLGGWSAGGICAFEAARQLAAAGEDVHSLILIDSPNPIGLQNPPARMYDFFQELGIFGTGTNIPKWLRAHFDAFIRMLDNYEAVPWSKSVGKAPRTLIVYAKDGVCKDPGGPRPEIRPDDPREMIWLLNNRTDFSADGWASLLGRDRLTIEVLGDVHHFSMMDSGPQMDKMGSYVRRALV